MTGSIADEAPIVEVNTTPLIDVMLVLLIMFIITIPPQSHAVEIDLPVAREAEPEIRERNKVMITSDGRLMWNGRPIEMPQFRSVLASLASLPKQPELQLEPEPEARYEMVDQVLAEVKRANVTTLGFVGNERYAQF